MKSGGIDFSRLGRFCVAVLAAAVQLLTKPVVRRSGWLGIGTLLAVIQGQTALQAAELPQVATGINARFEGAQAPVVTGNDMVINQTADKATLHWDSFNIGAGNQVEFKQPSQSAVALNRIFDAAPSQVNGKLTANGQLYLINQNGIVFGQGAQVNTQSLVASTLDIDDQVYKEIGFVNAINEPSGPVAAFDSFGRPMGEIHVAEGASLESGKGGRILIFAPTIVNEGTISTPEGQQVLAAAKDRVLIAASQDPDVRGLLVEVSTGGDVTNLGSLIAERGNVSMLGMAVNQDGVARATTSVSLNGSIRLVAGDMNGTLKVVGEQGAGKQPQEVRGGDVRLGSGSITEVVPDTAPGDDGQAVLAVDAQSQPHSRVDIAGTHVRLESGARVTSTGGAINLTAAANPSDPNFRQPADPDETDAALVVEGGAVVDASGDDSTVVSVARNVVDVEARGNELADSPLQRDGPIRNETLQVDIRRGTDFLNIDGAVASITRSAAERQSAGGTINVASEGQFTLEDGARLDVSGGQVTYIEGLVSTSRLLQANGEVVGIADADPNRAYLGLVANAVYREAGYVEGKDAGTLNIKASGIGLLGDVRAGSMAGAYQRWFPAELAAGTQAFARPFDQMPLAGSLAVTLQGVGLPELIIGTAPVSPAGTTPLVLSPELIQDSGAVRIGLVNAGPVLVNDPLQLPAWSSLTLTGTQVSVLNDIRIAGGQVRLNASNALVGALVVPDQALLAQVDGAIDLSGTWVNDNPLLVRGVPTAPIVLDGGSLTIDSGSSIDVSAASLLDVSAGGFRSADGHFTGGRGGSMSFATGAVELDPLFGSRLDLAGELRAFGFAGGGELKIATERIQVNPESRAIGDDDVQLDGSRQFGLREVSDGHGNRQFVFEVGAGTFQMGGFSSYSLASSRSDLEVAPGAAVNLRTPGYLLTGAAPSQAPTGTAMSSLVTPVFAPDFLRRPAELFLSTDASLGSTIGSVADLRIAPGASIRADAGSTISLHSATSLFVDGTLDAPAGSITLELGGEAPTFRPEQMIWLGATSALTANGTALINTLDPLGLRRGEVLDGGRVTIRADQGSIIGAAGARIAVDGGVATLDTGFGIPVRTQVGSAAGAIELIAAESLLYQGELSGAAPAGIGVPGGALTIGLDPTNRKVFELEGPDATPRGPNTLVMQDFTGTLPDAGAAVDPSLYSTGFVPLSQVRAGGFTSLDVVARSSAVGTDNSGAPVPDTPDSLPVIEFPVDLDLHLDRSIRLDAAVIKTDAAQVSLEAPYVAMGYSDSRVKLDGAIPDKTSTTNPRDTTVPIRLTPTPGAGTLNVTGDLIELVGEAVTQGFGDAAAGRDGVVLNSSGDVRMRGVRTRLKDDYAGLFRSAGNLMIDAQRIYPTTMSDFEVGVEGAGGRITLAGGGTHDAPLSVGGGLSLAADEIVQGSALFAPLGSLSLNAASALRFTDGSLTSTSAAGVSAPFFRTEPGGALIVPAPATGEDQLVFAETVDNPEFERTLPEKHINLAAPVVELQAGSQFDLNGGSDVRATEFVPGPGGSRDILLADLGSDAAVEPNPSFAIVPGIGVFAPYDPLETPAAETVQGLTIGDTFVLEEGLTDLPAGEYAILPARYALFGGFLVTPAAGTQDLSPGASLTRLDGVPILAGRFGIAGSDAADGRSQGFAIETGSVVRQRAEYLETPLDEFYTTGVLRAPRDAGTLVISAENSLQLQGELMQGQVTGGLGAAVDIATTAALSVVNQLSGAGGIELRATDLANLGADSLLLGGTRTRRTDGLQIDALSGAITIEEGVDLELPELLVVGGSIQVQGSAVQPTRLASTAPPSGRATSLFIDDDAAVLAVSDRQLTLNRAATENDGVSSLAVAADATLEAHGGLVLDAAGDVDAAGRLEGREGTISLGAGRISIGATDGQSIDGGLILSNDDLLDIAGSDLTLRSGGTIDVYGEVGSGGLAFRRLNFDAQGIRGLANDNVTAVLQADTIELGNGSGASLAGPLIGPATGSGLELRAGELQLGDGILTVEGYGATLINTTGSLLLAGESELQAGGDLTINTPLITSAVATSSTIQAVGRLAVTGAGDSTVAAGAGLGSTLTFSGTDIDFAGHILLPSGNVRLVQNGGNADSPPGAGLRIADQAVVDVSGEALTFGPKTVGTPGGSIELTAATGDLELGAALLDVSASAAGGAAGSVQWQAPLGLVTFSPDLRLSADDADGATGRFALDAAGLASSDASVVNPVTALTALLGSGGFHDSVALRLRQGDIVIGTGSAVAAREIRLVSDTGSIDIGGELNASGAQAGDIWLAAGDRLNVSGTIMARATDDQAAGGRVDLYALDADGDDPGGASDTVNLNAGSLVDVTGGPEGAGGEIFVHARRLDTTGDGQTDAVVLGDLSGNIAGASRAQLVATRVLRDPNATQIPDPATGTPVTQVTITSNEIEIWRAETEAFLAGLPAPTAGSLQITAGLQVESSGDLMLRDPWNFMDGWHFGQDLSDPTAPQPGLAGISTLRAARNLDLQADLTDSFTQQLLFGFLAFDAVAGAVSRTDGAGSVIEELVPQSWGYRLAAGADLASADVMAIGGGAGDVSLDPGARIRTGTADIDLTASGDVRLQDGAAVYTAGWDRGLSPQLKQAMAPATDPFGLTAYDLIGTFLDGAQFPDGGGAVTINARGDLIADTAPGSITAWLTRVGSGVIDNNISLYSDTQGFGAVPTHWGVVYDQFRNGIGAFGGGDLHIAVGGNVSNAVLALPTSGRVIDGVVVDTSTSKAIFQPSARTTEILGGGQLELQAGGSLSGGQVVIGRGTAIVKTAGDTGIGNAPRLYVGGDAQVDWTAGGSLSLAGLQDPTVVPLSDTQLGLISQIFANITATTHFNNRFFTYTDGSRVKLSALGGDVTFDGQDFTGLLPPSLTAAAFGGSVNVVAPQMDFFPSATGTLELLARDDVTGGYSLGARARQSDQDRNLLPSVDRPDIVSAAVVPAAVPVHVGDPVPNLVVARDGSIQSHLGNGGFWALELAKPAVFQAGMDISNLSVRVQNIADDALTSFQAGRDIVQGDLRGNTGAFATNDPRIFEIWGPGSAEFVAGRNISLGTSAGIETIGNTKNAALADQGAALRLLAGTGGEPAYDRFIDVYLSTAPSAYRDELNEFLAEVEATRAGYPSSNEEPHPLPIVAGAYADQLAQFLQDSGIAVVDDDPVATFRSLGRSLQREFITQVLFEEIRDWGSVAETPDRADRLNYIRGYTAMDTLFELGDPLGVRAGGMSPDALAQEIRDFLTILDPKAANEAQVQLFGTLFPQGERRGDVSLLLSQVQTIAGGSLAIMAPGGDINAGAADADVIDKEPADLGIVTARGGDIDIAVDNDLIVNSTRAFALQGDLLVWSSNGNIDAGKGAKTVTSIPDPITRVDPNTGNTIVEFPPAVSGSGLQGENAALFAPRGAVNAGDAGIRTSGDLTIGAVEIVGSDNIDVGGVEIGFSTTEAVPVAPPGAASASSAATKSVDSQAALLGDQNELGEREIRGTAVNFISVEVLSFGQGECQPGDKEKNKNCQ